MSNNNRLFIQRLILMVCDCLFCICVLIFYADTQIRWLNNLCTGVSLVAIVYGAYLRLTLSKKGYSRKIAPPWGRIALTIGLLFQLAVILFLLWRVAGFWLAA